jgi:4-amino-4-deoxy-L-arabinose transferase-like glycosyltransferase
VLFLAAWALFPLFFFSASSSKLPGYVLPSIPPLALLLGWRLVGWIEDEGKHGPVVAAAWIHVLVSALVAVAYQLVMRRRYDVGWMEAVPVSAVVLVPAIFALFYAKNGRVGRVVHVTLAQGAILVLALTQFAFPAIGRFDSTKDMARRIAAVRETGEPLVTYRFFQHTLHYYTGYTITADLQGRDSLSAFSRDHRHFLVVVPAAGVPELQRLPGWSCALLGEQGRLRLLRLIREP